MQPGLEAQAIDDDQVGLEQRLGILCARLVEVGVGIGPDQVAQFDVIAGNLLGNIGENAETGDNLQLVGGSRRQRGEQGAQGEQ
ncbi:hypothetical protein D3C84_1164590 [compost metagenome]